MKNVNRGIIGFRNENSYKFGYTNIVSTEDILGELVVLWINKILKEYSPAELLHEYNFIVCNTNSNPSTEGLYDFVKNREIKTSILDNISNIGYAYVFNINDWTLDIYENLDNEKTGSLLSVTPTKIIKLDRGLPHFIERKELTKKPKQRFNFFKTILNFFKKAED